MDPKKEILLRLLAMVLDLERRAGNAVRASERAQKILTALKLKCEDEGWSDPNMN